MDEANISSVVREGEILAGKYCVEKVLGAGGMGIVVAARHLELDERVALKFLRPEVRDNHEAVSRFAREARAAVKIKSEHVARVTDVGQLESGAPYMVMEFLDGYDLAGWLSQRGALPIEQAVEFVLQACEAIAEAHGLGIVHRDLKPANLFCIRRPDGGLSIKVLDFGISKITGSSAFASDFEITKTASVMGSPYYMSPEQLHSSRSVDTRTDIWSLGIILYELLSGRRPFVGETLPELCIKIANEPTPSLRTYRPEVTPELDQLVQHCLQKDRSRRYQNVAELAIALGPFGPKRALSSVERVRGILQGGDHAVSTFDPLPPPEPSGTLTVTQTGVFLGKTEPPKPSRKRFGIVSLGFALGGITLVLVFLLRGHVSPKPVTINSATQVPQSVGMPTSIMGSHPSVAQNPIGEVNASASVSSGSSAIPTSQSAFGGPKAPDVQGTVKQEAKQVVRKPNPKTNTVPQHVAVATSIAVTTAATVVAPAPTSKPSRNGDMYNGID